MELEELIENTPRRKHLEEMMDRPEKEDSPLEDMDNEQIKIFAMFLFEENQNKLIPAIKKIALQDGANVNVDETQLRYHAYNKKRKTYMWCLVNRKARIAIFFYKDTMDDEGLQKHGGRSRNVLKEFLGDTKIKSLQTRFTAEGTVRKQRKSSRS